MGKVISTIYATRDDQVTKLKSGPVSIVTGANLRSSSETSSESDEEAERLAWAKRVYRLSNRQHDLLKD